MFLKFLYWAIALIILMCVYDKILICCPVLTYDFFETLANSTKVACQRVIFTFCFLMCSLKL